MQIKNEEWRAVVGFEERYEVSNMGRVRRLAFRHSRVCPLFQNQTYFRFYPAKTILGCYSGPGTKYLKVTLHMNGVTKMRNVHNLVMEAFVGPRPAGMVTCHIDDDQRNNRLDNLRYGTQSENVRQSYQSGKRGKMSPNVTPAMREEWFYSTKTLDQLSAETGYHPVTISQNRSRYRRENGL